MYPSPESLLFPSPVSRLRSPVGVFLSLLFSPLLCLGSFYNYLFIVQLPTPSRDKSKLWSPPSIRDGAQCVSCRYIRWPSTWTNFIWQPILVQNKLPLMCERPKQLPQLCVVCCVCCVLLLLLLLRCCGCCCCEISKSLHFSSRHLTSATSFLWLAFVLNCFGPPIPISLSVHGIRPENLRLTWSVQQQHNTSSIRRKRSNIAGFL